MQHINRIMTSLSNEAIELASEINKGLIYGLDFQRDRKNTSMERIKDELTDLLATIDHIEIECKMEIISDCYGSARYLRKLSMLRMEEALEEMDVRWSAHDRPCGLPVPANEFKSLVELWIKIESFYRNFPISLIHDTCDTVNLINTDSIAIRENNCGQLSLREHAICEYFYKLFKDDSRPKYYADDGFNLSKFMCADRKWNCDQLWMALAMLIRRWSYLEKDQKDSEKKFIENELNTILGILIDAHEYNYEDEMDVKDKVDKGVEDCRKIGIKMNDGFYIDFFNNGIGTIIEVGETGLTRFTSDIYV